MVEPQTIPVLEARLRQLESDHDFLEAIKEKTVEVNDLEEDVEAKNEAYKAAKKKLEEAEKELRDLIQDGPPKEDPQKRIPFTDYEQPKPAAPAQPVAETQPAVEQPPVSEPPAEEEVAIAPEIAGMDISDLQKKRLAKAGCVTLADVVDLANGNWPQYPNGLESLQGFGPKQVAKIKALLPSTAPAVESTEAKTVKVRILNFSAGNDNIVPMDLYDATELENGNVIVQLPGQNPVEFLPHEFEKEGELQEA